MTVTINGTTGVSLCAASSVPSTALQSGVPSRSQLPAGTVLQVVSVTYSSGASSSSSTFSDTGLTATITPTSATSKIMVFVDHVGCGKNTNNTYLLFLLVRNSTNLIQFESEAGYNNSTSPVSIGSCSTNYLDSPATTSAVTYKTQFKSNSNSASVFFGANSSITLMEIAA